MSSEGVLLDEATSLSSGVAHSWWRRARKRAYIRKRPHGSQWSWRVRDHASLTIKGSRWWLAWSSLSQQHILQSRHINRHVAGVTVHVTVKAGRSAAAQRITLAGAALLLLLLLGHRSVPHGDVVAVAAVRGVGVLTSCCGGLNSGLWSLSRARLPIRRSWLLRHISITVAVIIAGGPALVTISLISC
jgi:hypothetical protein